jgi:hypothetical protein
MLCKSIIALCFFVLVNQTLAAEPTPQACGVYEFLGQVDLKKGKKHLVIFGKSRNELRIDLGQQRVNASFFKDGYFIKGTVKIQKIKSEYHYEGNLLTSKIAAVEPLSEDSGNYLRQKEKKPCLPRS